MTSPESQQQTIDQDLQQAITHQQAGELQKAGEIYRTILQDHPNHPDANFNMGVVAVLMKQPAAGLPYFLAALEADTSSGKYWLNYIDALFQSGQLEDARQVLVLAKQQGLQGDEVEALTARLTKPVAPRLQAGKPVLHKGKAPGPQETNALVALFNNGQFMEAARLAQRMTVRFPRHEFGWKALGAAFKQLGQNTDALAPMQKAVELAPRDAEAHNNLGNVLSDLKRLDEAEASYRKALKLNPKYDRAYNNLGANLQALNRLDEAEACYRSALQINPDYIRAHCNLGITLNELGRVSEAEACFKRVLQDKPDDIKALNGLGSSLMLQGKTIEAEASLRRVLDDNPDNPNALNSLGLTLLDLGRVDEADACFRRLLLNHPDNAHAHSNLLYYLTLSASMDAETLFSEHLNFGEKFEAPYRDICPQFTNPKDPERCLQVGFVSGDLRNHAVANFFEPVAAHLSGYSQLSLHAYSNSYIEDDVTQRVRKYFAHWNSVVGMSDAAMAEKIRTDKIDILVDLSGHTAKNRLQAFAGKPAPIQASWMGYPGTTGLKAMDYYLSDRFLLPPGLLDNQFTEKIARLPANAPFLPFEFTSTVNELPALGNGYVTFGSFNRPNKLNPPVIALWSQILRALPDSRMLLGGMSKDGHYENIIELFTQEGIALERLSFHTRSTMENYLKLHQQVDFCLDTFPYNGGTTTCHALWMGVPTLTLAGDTLPGRVGAGILGHAKLEEFIANDATDFVQKGLFWAGNLAALSDIRKEMRERFSSSAMSQSTLIAAGLERALRIMWQRWCAGLPPESFEAYP